MVGKPVVKGTRLTVELLVDLLENGWSEQEIIRNYPGITPEGILACLNKQEGDGYGSLCPELDSARQGSTVEEARDNLKEALELYFENASSSEIQYRRII